MSRSRLLPIAGRVGVCDAGRGSLPRPSPPAHPGGAPRGAARLRKRGGWAPDAARRQLGGGDCFSLRSPAAGPALQVTPAAASRPQRPLRGRLLGVFRLDAPQTTSAAARPGLSPAPSPLPPSGRAAPPPAARAARPGFLMSQREPGSHRPPRASAPVTHRDSRAPGPPQPPSAPHSPPPRPGALGLGPAPPPPPSAPAPSPLVPLQVDIRRWPPGHPLSQQFPKRSPLPGAEKALPPGEAEWGRPRSGSRGRAEVGGDARSFLQEVTGGRGERG